MAKCLTCGTINPEDNIYCAKCGTQLVGATNSASAAAYEEAQKQFEQDALIGLNKDKIVYTCLLCGSVNRIENEVCSKCGKKRPRNEYVAALKKTQESRAAQEQYAAEQKAEAEAKAAEAQPILPEEPQPEKKLALYKFVEEPKQLPQTVQPLVIVPYVNTEQPLWQYQPSQVYRFQPATYQERLAAEQRAYAAQYGEPPTQEALIRMRDQAEAELRALDSANPAKVQYNVNKKKVRASAVFSIIISIAAIVMFFLFALTASTAQLKGYGFVKALGVSIDAAFGTGLGLGAIAYTYNGAVSFVVPVCVLLAVVLIAFVLVFGIIRLVTGRARVKGFVAPLIAFAAALAATITLISLSNYGFKDIGGFFADAEIGLYSLLGAPLLLFVVGLLCPKNIKLGG